MDTDDIPGSDIENSDDESTIFLGEEKESDEEFNKKEYENHQEVHDEIERQFQNLKLSQSREAAEPSKKKLKSQVHLKLQVHQVASFLKLF